MGKIEINKLIYENIFNEDFKSLCDNKVVEFCVKGKGPRNGLALVYAPNGSGKTTITKMLDKNTKTQGEIEIDYIDKNENRSSLNGQVKVIYDQNVRNIIEGETSEFIVSKDIVEIGLLEQKMISEFMVVADNIKKILNDVFFIKNVTDINLNELGILKEDVKDFINARKKKDEIEIKKFILKVDNQYRDVIPKEADEEKFDFIKNNYHKKNELIDLVLKINVEKVKKNTKIKEIEEKEIAIGILEKYENKDECIVCDNVINPKEIKERKMKQCEKIKNNLDKYYKDTIEKIIKNCEESDCFGIKKNIVSALETGDIGLIENLQKELLQYINYLKIDLINNVTNIVDKSNMKNIIKKIDELVQKQPTIDGEDIIFLTEIISNNLDKRLDIQIDPTNNKRINLRLNGDEIIGVNRESLKLSNGEQNFISLAFEFMRARKCEEKIIVIDDPISSFDSIYKNKIIYCINSLAEDKECLVLTHNIDLIKLMDAQGGTFNLYIFNNKEDGNNGFIPIEKAEKEIILKLNKLNDLFRKEIADEICDLKIFLIAMIPYMRGYANIIGNKKCYKELCNVMHWQQEKIKVNLSEIYHNLFIQSYSLMNEGDEACKSEKLWVIDEAVEVDYEEIINIINNGLEDIEVLEKESKYVLLNKTLRHTLIYLSLRLNVENTLMPLIIEKPKIAKKVRTGKNILLGEIIRESLNDDKFSKVFFMSRKTLVNDFNHFEGNMDIFQPAIDIKDSALKREYEDIMKKLETIKGNII